MRSVYCVFNSEAPHSASSARNLAEAPYVPEACYGLGSDTHVKSISHPLIPQGATNEHNNRWGCSARVGVSNVASLSSAVCNT